MNTQKIIQLSKKLISFPSTENNIKARHDIIKYVKKEFNNLPVHIKEYNSNNNPSIVITLKKEKNPFLFLSGHLDVIPATKEDDYKAKIKGNKLYGRGSGDMKTACAVMIELIKKYSQKTIKPSIGLMLTTDEEVSGEDGVGYLIKKQKYSSRLAIVPDGGFGLNTLVINQKGNLVADLVVHGKSAHSARPYLGKNAIDELMKTYVEMRKIIPEIKTKKWGNTINLSSISGGDVINKVPENAKAIFDIRYLDKESGKYIIDEFKKISRNIKVISNSDPFVQDKHHHLIKQYLKITRTEIKGKIEFLKYESTSDARYFSAKNIPTIITKIYTENIHSDNEWVDLKEMEKFYCIMSLYIDSLNI